MAGITTVPVFPGLGGAFIGGHPVGTAAGAPSSALARSRGAVGQRKLTRQEERVVRELKQRDREVRQHEQAHLAAAGPYARGRANFTHTIGPDGRRYATGGEVSIDVSPERTPEATIQKMQVVKRAAMAPADPSPQDRAVYAAAARQEMKARQELTRQRQAELHGEEKRAGGALVPGARGRSGKEVNIAEPLPGWLFEDSVSGEAVPQVSGASAVRQYTAHVMTQAGGLQALDCVV